MWKIIVLCIVTMGLATAKRVSYENYKLLSTVPITTMQLKFLQALGNLGSVKGYSFWKEPSLVDREVLLMVAPHVLSEIDNVMTGLKIPYKVTINNVQKLIDDRIPTNQTQGFDFHSYHTLKEIYNNLDELAEKYPNKVQVVVGGRTWKGRQIKGVRIINGKGKPGIFIEGGIHAREWISPATVMYILHQILMSNDSNVRHIADNHNWFIFPIFNPDGYKFSWTADPMWRKTRKPSGPDCIGSDPNRNWDFQWNTTGVNTNPCAENYPGSEPFSEIEMKSMSEYIMSNIGNFYAYVSFHSYSQQLMFPYAYTTAHISNYDELYRVGSIAIEALKQRYQTQYVTGSIGEFHAKAGGVSVDYVAGVLRKPVVYEFDLRDKGFLLPPHMIIPTGEETLDAVVAIFTETLSQEYARND